MNITRQKILTEKKIQDHEYNKTKNINRKK